MKLTLEMYNLSSKMWHLEWHSIDPKLQVWFGSFRVCVGCAIKAFNVYFRFTLKTELIHLQHQS